MYLRQHRTITSSMLYGNFTPRFWYNFLQCIKYFCEIASHLDAEFAHKSYGIALGSVKSSLIVPYLLFSRHYIRIFRTLHSHRTSPSQNSKILRRAYYYFIYSVWKNPSNQPCNSRIPQNQHGPPEAGIIPKWNLYDGEKKTQYSCNYFFHILTNYTTIHILY